LSEPNSNGEQDGILHLLQDHQGQVDQSKLLIDAFPPKLPLKVPS
jgi:hypothetical protein